MAKDRSLTLIFEQCDLKINMDHLMIGGNPCPKFGIDQVKGSKVIDRTTKDIDIDKELVLQASHEAMRPAGFIRDIL